VPRVPPPAATPARGWWLGYLEDFPDYWTQGESLEDLKEHLRDLHDDLSNDRIPEVRRTAELEVN
jgi:predicted RNase H-like HicB family nuclease